MIYDNILQFKGNKKMFKSRRLKREVTPEMKVLFRPLGTYTKLP